VDGERFFVDRDGDGRGDGGLWVMSCQEPVGYVANADDCDDFDAAVHPGALELCDGIDNDCANGIDDPAPSLLSNCNARMAVADRCVRGQCAFDCADGFEDLDGDLHGIVTNGCECEITGPETCDQADNDCDGDVDEGLDACICVPSNGGVEICDDIDNDCDGEVDNGLDPEICGCVPSNDGIEICDLEDNDCDGRVDELGTDLIDACEPPDGATVSACANGVCVLACLRGRVDVNGDLDDEESDGCECISDGVEWCDDRDNDCNGAIDDGQVCEDLTVANTDPFTDGAYFQGTTSEGLCGREALQQFWPTLDPDFFSGFGCYARRYVFRRPDYAIYYHATFSGILEDHEGEDLVVDTPPCGDRVGGVFGFDGDQTLHYTCSGELRRGNGELVTQQIVAYVATLPDGRSVITRSSELTPREDDYVVLGPDGSELARLDPHVTFSGSLAPVIDGCSIQGDTAYLLFHRTYGQNQRELVGFRLTQDNEFQLMRRVPVDAFGTATMLVSDGTMFIRERDPNETLDERIRAFTVDNEEAVVWREADAPRVRAHIGDQLLTGPRLE
jgi:hypothetical protein